jgi:ankyrin repeat protein
MKRKKPEIPKPPLIEVISSQDYNENLLDDCRRLLADGADPNARDANGNTALIWAAFRGYTDIVLLLLPVSDVYAKDNGGQDAVDNAEELGHTQCAKVIKAYIRSKEEAKDLDGELTAKTDAITRNSGI